MKKLSSLFHHGLLVLSTMAVAVTVASDVLDTAAATPEVPLQSIPYDGATTIFTDNDRDANSNSDDKIRVKVDFYGESLCPFCRKFVTEAWPKVWLDVEGLRPYVDYDMVPWGNAYFATDDCGRGPYSPDERACWYSKCITKKKDRPDGSDDIATEKDESCFAGNAVYQHGEKEGIVDIYESCIKVDYSLEAAVDFTYCAEGSIMDNEDINVEKLLTICAVTLLDVDSKAVQKCADERGKQLEIANAKQTPEHPGVPYVLLDGMPVDNPMDIQAAICAALQEKGLKPLPGSCGSVAYASLRGQKTSRH